MKPRFKAANYLKTLVLVSVLLAACSLSGPQELTEANPTSMPALTPQALQPTNPEMEEQPVDSTPGSEPVVETPAIVRTQEPSEPEATAALVPTLDDSMISPGWQLAFLRNSDIWLLDSPDGEPYQLTIAGDILSFAWSPDGRRLAAFNGRSLCFFHGDGSVRTACLELGLNEEQAQIVRRMVWSPDQRWIVLWNPTNPQDEGAIGWLAVALDTTSAMWRIQDPVDWGAALAPDNDPGGFTGEPIFLPDGALIGTISHRYLCGSGGCRYQLYSFNLADLTPTFSPYPNRPEDGWSEGRGLLLSADRTVLTNYGVVMTSCDIYHTYVDRFNLSNSDRRPFVLENQAVSQIANHPEGFFTIARSVMCITDEVEVWSRSCGLSSGFEVLSMANWDPDANNSTDLVPGVEPSWSPNGEQMTFQSCLRKNDVGTWEPDGSVPPSVYLMNPDNEIRSLGEGSQPAWKP